ncbi:NB-ARC domain-containing protein [Streptosporangium sp. NBC_01495]|uniref:NB-ARC domain-containing protein n=1 Tax=Streptosporangium sp. NBC_01495 TaxID=2903899 RepID=UPI002E361E93|nr:NB-ARC domain-containing protein [Streptosporangium sp. NBC_01495]
MTDNVRGIFAARLDELINISELPPDTIVREVSRRRPAGESWRLTVQRLSDWRHGKNVPNEKPLRLLVRVLIEHARARGVVPDPVTRDLLNERNWPHWREEARAETVKDGTAPVIGLAPATDFVPRAGLHEQVLAAVLAEPSRQESSMVFVWGPGGFGKTTLAQMVSRDERVRRRFADGVLWIVLGMRTTDQELAAKINDLSGQLTGNRPTFVDPQQAGYFLGALLSRRSMLVVIDDVWSAEQLAPFLGSWQRSVRLVTSRVSALAPDEGVTAIEVGPMTAAESAEMVRPVISTDVPGLPALLEHSAGWPVLLALVRGALRKILAMGMSAEEAVAQIEGMIAVAGPAALDPPGGEPDVNDPRRRNRAAAATIEVSLSLLATTGGDGWLDRYVDLAVFPRETEIPLYALEHYWAARGAMSRPQAYLLCAALADLSLLTVRRVGSETRVTLHQVIYDYLWHRVGDGLPDLHADLVSAISSQVPSAEDGGPHWPSLSSELPFYWRWLPHHIREAHGDGTALVAVLADLDWTVGKLNLTGPAEVEADLLLSVSETARLLRNFITQNAHLLAPTDPVEALGAVLLCRLPLLPELATGRAALESTLPCYWLKSEVTSGLPDRPDPALTRVIIHGDWLTTVSVTADDRWLVTGADDGKIRILSSESGKVTAIWEPAREMLGEISYDEMMPIQWENAQGNSFIALATKYAVHSHVLSPDETWLAAGCLGAGIAIWDLRKQRLRAVIEDGEMLPYMMTSTSDGRLMVTCDNRNLVRSWNSRDGRPHATMAGHNGAVYAMTSLGDDIVASGGEDGYVRIWNVREGSEQACWGPVAGQIRSIAYDARANLIAVGVLDGPVTLIDAADGSQRTSAGNAFTESVVFSRDGKELFAGLMSGEIVVLTTPDITPVRLLLGHDEAVECLMPAVGDRWIASASRDGSLRIWSKESEAPQPVAAPSRLSTPPTGGLWRAPSGPADHAPQSVNTLTRLLRVSSVHSWKKAAERHTFWQWVHRINAALLWGENDEEARKAIIARLESVSRLSESRGEVEDEVSSRATFAAYQKEGTVTVVEVPTGLEITTMTGLSGTASVRFAPQEDYVVMSADGRAQIWSLTEPGTVVDLDVPEGTRGEFAWWLLVSPLGDWTAIASETHVWVCDSRSGRIRGYAETDSASLVGVDGKEGSWFASYSDGLDFWSAEDCTRLFSGGELPGGFSTLAQHPNGRWICAADNYGGVNIMRYGDGAAIGRLDGHKSAVNDIAFSSDGQWIATVDLDGQLRVWEALTKTCVTVARADGALVRCQWQGVLALSLVGRRGLYSLALRQPGEVGARRMLQKAESADPYSFETAVALLALGRVLGNSEKDAEGLAAYERAFEIYHRHGLDQTPEAAPLLRELSILTHRVHGSAAAEAIALRVLGVIPPDVHNSWERGQALHLIAGHVYAQGRVQEAARLLVEACDAAEAVGVSNRRGEYASLLSDCARICYQAGDRPATELTLLRRIAVLKTMDQTLPIGAALFDLARFKVESGRADQAVADYRAAVTALEGADGEYSSVRESAFDELVGTLIGLGDLAEVEEALSSGGGKAEHFLGMARMLSGQKRYAEAVEPYERAMAAFYSAENMTGVKFTVRELGLTYYELEEFGKSEPLLARSLELYEAADPAGAETGTALIELARVVGELGGAEANAYYERAIALLDALGDEHLYALGMALRELASRIFSAGLLTEAEPWYRRAIENEETRNPGSPFGGMLMFDLGRILLDLGRPEEACELMAQALRHWAAPGSISDEIRSFAREAYADAVEAASRH